MTMFRDFADNAKQAVAQLVLGLRGERDLSPMVILGYANDDVRMVGVDAEFFHPDFPERRRELVARFIVPMIHEHAPEVVALAYAGWLYEGAPDAPAKQEVITATIVDREVTEVWWAPLWKDVPVPTEAGRMLLGEWREWPSSTQTGLFLTPIQEALR